MFPQGSSCLVVLWILPPCPLLRLRGFHPLRPAFPGPFCWTVQWLVQSEPHGARAMVWALPRSLAATYGITVVFSSSGYLDVSVRRVPSSMPMCSAWGGGVFPRRVSPFRHLRIAGHLLLPAAFRSLSRLSSAPGAKASALCPSSLNRGTPRASPLPRLAWRFRGRPGRSRPASPDTGLAPPHPRASLGPASRRHFFLLFSMPVGPPPHRMVLFFVSIRFSRYSHPFSVLLMSRRPPALPRRPRRSTIGRLGLDHRVRDGNGYLPQAHRHRNLSRCPWHLNSNAAPTLPSLERR